MLSIEMFVDSSSPKTFVLQYYTPIYFAGKRAYAFLFIYFFQSEQSLIFLRRAQAAHPNTTTDAICAASFTYTDVLMMITRDFDI